MANYPGAVMNRISRTRRVNTNIRGTVVVSFRVAPNGGLAAVSVAASSGNAELDQIALDHIRRAAPFPAPPAGAQTSFQVNFRGN